MGRSRELDDPPQEVIVCDANAPWKVLKALC